MISEIYGFPVYVGKLSNVEKFMQHIQDFKLEKSDDWNANCLVSSSAGSSALEDQKDPIIDDCIHEEVCLHGQHYLKELGVDVKVTANQCNNQECKECRDIWVNKYEKGHSQDLHWHVHEDRKIMFSFVCFLKYDSTKDANFVFVNPIPKHGIHCQKLREHPSFSVTMKPHVEEGTIMIFPPWMLHYVETQKSEGSRITMAGNFYENKSE